MPPASYFDEKARTPLRSMTIVDLKFHAGEVFVAGVSNEEFSSTLRRIPYPFTGAASETQLEIYHLAHGMYETRAPIRTMQFANIDGEDLGSLPSRLRHRRSKTRHFAPRGPFLPRSSGQGTALGRPLRTLRYFFLPKIPEPPVWVATAVWSHDELLLALESQPAVFGSFG